MIYTFHERNNFAHKHMYHVENYLNSLSSTVSIENVEDITFYQKLDIDLLWKGKDKNNNIISKTIEVKIDSYHHSGNIFFEIISNDTKNTNGCMLVSKADYLFYFFPDIDLLYSFKLSEFKDWALDNQHRFKIRKCKNPTYNSWGYLIPRSIIENECDFVKKIII